MVTFVATAVFTRVCQVQLWECQEIGGPDGSSGKTSTGPLSGKLRGDLEVISTIMNPVQCPDCECYETGPTGEEDTYLCRGCGMVWSPGKFREDYSQEELDLYGPLHDFQDFATEEAFGEGLITLPEEDVIPCPLCSSTKTVGLAEYSGELSSRGLCQACGCEFSVLECMGEEDEEAEQGR